MNDWIVDRNDLAIDFYRVWYPYVVFGKHARQRLGECGLARSRRAIEEDRGAGVERRSELPQHLAVDHKMGKGALNVSGVHRHVLGALFSSLLYVAIQRHRRGARILTLGQQFHRSRSALGGDGKIGRA